MPGAAHPPASPTPAAGALAGGARRRLFWLLLVVLTAGGIAGGSELLARLAGYEPWETFDRYLDHIGEPVLHDFDAELGWLGKPGRYVMPPYDLDARETGAPVVTTIWPGGLRATAAERRSRPVQVFLCGCSFTQGFAISDDETFAYQLQSRLPDVELLNFGTAGYGTYQCLLRLRRYLDVGAPAPALVVYGFFQDHEGRNVAAAYWLRALAMVARRGHVRVPYCLLGDGGGLDCRGPEVSYRAWWGTPSSALLAFLQERYETWRTADRARQARVVTQRLLRELDALARRHGARFLTVILHADGPKYDAYRRFLSEASLDFVDCVDPRYGTPAMVVPGEVHPNGKMNTVWADCIEGPLRRRLERPPPTGVGPSSPSPREPR